MPSYLVESYAPAASASEAEAAIARLADDDRTIRYLRSSFVPADETCFHLVEAGSLDAVRAALARADISYERIAETVEFDADRGTDAGRPSAGPRSERPRPLRRAEQKAGGIEP